MPIVLGDPNEGGFAVQQPHPRQIINLAPGGGGGGGGQDLGPALEYQNQAAQARQTQGAQLQAWLFQQDLTAREQMDLQRRQNAVSYVQNDENLSDEVPEGGGMSERQALLFQLRTGIDPLRARLEQSQQRHQQAITQHLMQQNAQASAVQNEDAGWFNDQMDRRAIRVDGRVVGFWGNNGEMHFPSSLNRQERQEHLDPGELTDAQWLAHRNAVAQRQQREFGTPGTEGHGSIEDREAGIEREMRSATGHGNINELREARRQRREERDRQNRPRREEVGRNSRPPEEQQPPPAPAAPPTPVSTPNAAADLRARLDAIEAGNIRRNAIDQREQGRQALAASSGRLGASDAEVAERARQATRPRFGGLD